MEKKTKYIAWEIGLLILLTVIIFPLAVTLSSKLTFSIETFFIAPIGLLIF